MTRIILVLLLASAACDRRGNASVTRANEPKETDTNHPKLETVTVGPAPAHWTDTVPARIVFDETRTSRIGAPLGGRVSGVRVELGQHVKVNDPLVVITSGDLAEFYGARDKAKTDLDAAEVTYKRVKELVDLGSLPKKELDSAEQDLREATVGYETANQKIASLKVGTNDATQFTIVAPRAGVVVEKTVAVGQQVSPDSGSILAITDLSDVWVVADLLEDAVQGIKVGARAEVTIDGVPHPLEGRVGQVAQIVDPERHTVPVRVKLENPEGALRPNALAQIRFYDDQPGPISVPAEAVLSDGATSYVYVMRDGQPKRQEVVAGPHNAKLIAIHSGISVGDQIVARGAGLLDNQLPQQELPK